MPNEILSYFDMCQREGTSLQRGMNFGLGGNYSVILMSIRQNSPYDDRVEDDGSVVFYEGHDVPRSNDHPDPKKVNQEAITPNGSITQNGRFFKAAQDHKKLKTPPEKVKVYEKIRSGIWSYNGIFHLVDAWKELSGNRSVFKFKLVAVEEPEDFSAPATKQPERRRVIPTHVKLEVWKRDRGRCVICHATDELHFDHILPYSKGGTSITADNVQILCARHNLQKSDKIA